MTTDPAPITDRAPIFTPGQIKALAGRIYHDEDVTVYFNGIVAFQEGDYLTSYKNITFSPEALNALTPDGNNIVAIECTNKGGGQYIDLGLTGIRSIPTGTVRPVAEQATPSGIYNLSAQRLSFPRPGINIVNGKKILY